MASHELIKKTAAAKDKRTIPVIWAGLKDEDLFFTYASTSVPIRYRDTSASGGHQYFTIFIFPPLRGGNKKEGETFANITLSLLLSHQGRGNLLFFLAPAEDIKEHLAFSPSLSSRAGRPMTHNIEKPQFEGLFKSLSRT